MEQSIARALEQKNDNHLFPFIRVTGDETEEVLREEVVAVYRSSTSAEGTVITPFSQVSAVMPSGMTENPVVLTARRPAGE